MTEELITIWDIADHLKTEEDRISYLDAVVEENDPLLLLAALEDIETAKEISRISDPSPYGSPFFQPGSSIEPVTAISHDQTSKK
jgi:DNA-binding phage protein